MHDQNRPGQNVLAASQRSDVSPFLALDVLRDAGRLESEGRAICHLEVGQPAAPAPAGVRQAAAEALEHGRIGYTESLGIPELRARIARYYRDMHGIEVPPERVVVTTGSSAGFVLAFLAAFDAGQRVALVAPGYPAYSNILASLGLETAWLEATEATRWAPTPEMLDAAQPLDGLLIASPANPSGTVIAPRTLGDLIEAAHRRSMWFISDEIYHGLTYGPAADTALSHSDEAIIVNSFSKYYCMTGWRIGWLVVPERLVRPIERLAQNLYISAPALSQHAALAAFDCDAELEANRAVYAENRALLLDALPRIGLDRVLPMDGAFYAYVDVSRYTNDSLEFARRLLHEAGVATTPGADFDPARGSRFIRLSFAGAREELAEAVDRLETWLPR